MKQEEQIFWQIHDFLKGRLKGEALEEFQKQLTQDITLQEEVAKHELANQLIIQNRLRQAEQVATETQIQYRKELLYKKIRIGIGVAFVLSILLFLGLRHENETSLATTKEVSKKESTEILKDETSREEKTEILKEKNSKVTSQSQRVLSSEKKGEQIASPIETPQQIAKEVTIEKVKTVEVHTLPSTVEEKPIPPSLPKKEEVAKAEKSCVDTKIKASISVTNACYGDNNGAITASRFQGGVAPYHYEVQSYANSHVFPHSALPLGSYVVLITDAHHCTAKIDNVIVKGVICEEVEKVFNPFLDEILELPSYSSGGTFVVHEKNGSVFYKKEIIQGEKIEWNGMSSQGQMESGHFSYEIQYHDGTRKQGSITITR